MSPPPAGAWPNSRLDRCHDDYLQRDHLDLHAQESTRQDGTRKVSLTSRGFPIEGQEEQRYTWPPSASQQLMDSSTTRTGLSTTQSSHGLEQSHVLSYEPVGLGGNHSFFKVGRVFRCLWVEYPIGHIESKTIKAGRGEQVASGRLAGNHTTALVDTGAGRNFVSARWLARRRISYDRKSTCRIKRADASFFNTVGTVVLPWSFNGEKDTYKIEFSVLLDRFCAYPDAVILGNQFMRSTKTLTHFKGRLHRRDRRGSDRRVFFQSGSQLRMNGYCDGHEVAALPDSCSDLPLISLDFARCLGRPIEDGEDCLVDLELPGQHHTRTQGRVRQVPWQFERDGTTHYIDFHILDGLCADVLLDEEFLDSTNAFEEFAEHLVDMAEAEDEVDGLLVIFLNIRIVRGVKRLFQKRVKQEDPPGPITVKIKSGQIELLDKMEAVLQSDMPKQQKESEMRELCSKYTQLGISSTTTSQS